jgi:amino-acid N-acetyltransferase
MEYPVELAREDDLSRIEAMLMAAGLPTEGVLPLIGTFQVIRDQEGEVVAAAVIEWHAESAMESNGLLRSVVVDPAQRGNGLGKTIVRAIMASTSRDLYLLTDSATDFFRRLGFESIDRSLAPPALRQSEEFRCLCGESAAFMRRSVIREA